MYFIYKYNVPFIVKMDYDLSICHLQRDIKALQSKGDYQRDISGLADTLSSIFKEHSDKTPVLIYYLVLSSDHGLSDILLDDPIVGFLLNSELHFEMKHIVEVIFQLKLQRYLYEIIYYGPVGITAYLLKVFDSFIQDKVLSEDCDRLSICSDHYEIAEATLGKVVSLISKEQYKECSCMWHFFQLSLSKIVDASLFCFKTAGSEQFGHHVQRFASFLKRAINKCYDKTVKDADKIEFYMIGNEYCPKVKKSTSPLHSIDTVLDKMLENLETVLSVVSCDVWIAWEDYLFGPSLTLQTEIGNKMYDINELIEKHSIYITNQMRQCLTHLKLKTLTEEDVIAKATLEEKVQKISDGSSNILEKWYTGLIAHEEVWNNSKNVFVLLKNINLCESPENIMIKTINHLQNVSNDSNVRNLLLSKLKMSHSTCQVEIFKYICERHSIGLFTSNGNYDENFEIFNKLSAHSEVSEFLSEIIHIIVQFPLAITQLFKLAISSSENHKICVEALKNINPVLHLSEFSDSGIESKIIDLELFNYVMKKLFCTSHADKEWRNLASFLVSLYRYGIDIPKSFIPTCLIGTLEMKMKDKDWCTTKYLMMVLHEIVAKENVSINSAVLLAFLGQVAIASMWDVTSFNGVKAEIKFILNEIIPALQMTCVEEDLEWLRETICNLPEPVRVYFCDLWLTKGLEYPGNSELYHRLLISLSSKSKIVATYSESCDNEVKFIIALVKVLPILHTTEWHPLYTNCCELLAFNELISVFKLFSNAMTVISLCTDRLDMFDCFKYCMCNFTGLFDALYTKRVNLVSSDWLLLFKLLLRPLSKALCPAVKNDCYLLMLPILLKIVKLQITENECENGIMSFVEAVDVSWRDNFKKALRID